MEFCAWVQYMGPERKGLQLLDPVLDAWQNPVRNASKGMEQQGARRSPTNLEEPALWTKD